MMILVQSISIKLKLYVF